jgi:hypothetical protein
LNLKKVVKDALLLPIIQGVCVCVIVVLYFPKMFVATARNELVI